MSSFTTIKLFDLRGNKSLDLLKVDVRQQTLYSGSMRKRSDGWAGKRDVEVFLGILNDDVVVDPPLSSTSKTNIRMGKRVQQHIVA